MEVNSFASPPAYANQVARLSSAGGVGTFVTGPDGVNNPTDGQASFSPSTPTDAFTIYYDDVEGTQNVRAFFDFSSPVPVTISAPTAVDDISNNNPADAIVTVSVLANDVENEFPIDPTTVILTGTGAPAGSILAADGKTLSVPNEGVWAVNPITGDVTFTPEAGFASDPTVAPYIVSDTNGAPSAAADISISYDYLPTAVDDTVTGLPTNTPAVADVLDNDSDPDGTLDPATVQIAGTAAAGDDLIVPGEGTWSVDTTTGEITFTPEAGFTADPTPITYTVADNDGNVSNPASVALDFDAQSPTAVDDTVTGLPTNTPAVADVLDNDSDPDGTLDPATVQIAGTAAAGDDLIVPGEGTWSVDTTTGEITFTPEAGFTADPTPITYTVADNDGNVSNPASVALDFDAQSPTAVDDTVTGLPTNTPAVADVLGNDSDPDGTLDPATVQIAGTAAAGDDLIVPGEGTWSVDTTTGEITFTPEAGFTADPTPITYTVADNDGNVSNPASVALDFDAQSPTAVDDTVTGLPTNTPAVADVLDNDSDPDGTLDPATVQIAGTAAAGDDLIVPGEGTWSVDTTTGEITFTPEAGFTADPTPITYTVADNDGNVSNPASVALDFDAQSPTAVDDTVTGLPTNTPAVADVLGNDSDPDGTLDPATVQIAGTAAAGDDLIVPGEGTWSVDTTTGEITFTPEAGFTADPTPITYTVADNDGNVSNPASVALDFDAQSPTAVDDTVTGLPTNTPAVADVLDNDSDPDGTLDPATVQIAGTAAAGDDLIVPGEGTWSVDTTTGEITFTPEAGFTADPTPITYTVADNDGNVSNPASVALDFDAQSPTAVDDTVTGLPTNTPAVADVLDNDSDPDGTLDPATVQIAGTAAAGDDLIVPGEGTWSVDTTTGEITFTPEAGFTADPTPITYTVADNDGNVSNPASVALDFDAQSPTAVDDTVTGLPTNTPAVADVLGNDSDPDGTLDPATVQIAGTAAAGDDLIVPGEGTWSVDTTTGEITFTPEAGFTADPTPITYTVADNDGNVSNPASVALDFDAQSPTAVDDTVTGLPTNTPAVADVLDNDSDPDGTLDPATVQIAGTAAAGDDLIVPGEGTWSVDTTTGEITFTPEAGFTADPTPITYTVADNDGNVSNPASVALDFDAQSPTAVDDTVTGLPTNTPAVADVLGNDSDPDGTLDPATVQIAGTAAAGDDLIVPGEGTWSVDTTTGEITFTPEAGFTADPTPITYTVADNDGNVSNPASVALDFDAQSPTAVDDTVTGLPTNTPAVADVLGNDSDPDGTLDPATVQIAGTAAAGDDLIVPGEGTWSVDTTTGEITFTPEAGFTADPTPITYTVADNDGNVSNPASVALDFDAQSPTAVDDTVTGLPTNTPAVADVLDNDSDPDGTLDPATVQIAGTAAAGDDLIVPGEGTWSVDTTTGEITFTPEAGFTADPTPITYTVADNDGNVSNPASVALDFDAQSPTAVDDTVTGLPTNTPAVADVLGNDSDPDGTLDPATVQIAGTAAAGDDLIVPGEGTWSVDTTTGEITFTPEAGFTADPTPITYTVADNDGNVSNPASVALDFDAQSPTAVDDTVTGLPTNTPAVADVLDNDSDPDGTLDPATVQIAGTAAAGDDLIVPGEGTWSVDTTTGEITFTPEAGFTADPTPITYTVADNDGNVSNPASVALDFDAQSPTAVDDTVTGLPTNTPAVADVLGNDSDPDGTLDPATVQIAGTAAAGDDLIVPGEGTWSVDTTTGEITFTPEAGFTADPTPITYTVADNDGNVSNPASVALDFDAQSPTAVDDTVTGLPTNTPAVADVLGNDSDPDGTLDPATVQIAGTAAAGDDLIVPGEGTWSVDTTTGEITFTPEAGFTADPTPITYTVADNDGNVSNPASVALDFDAQSPTAVDDTVTGLPTNTPAVADVLDNDSDPDGTLDPATVQIAGTAAAGDDLIVPGEGTWSVDTTTGEITFTPEAGFTADPTPITYTVADNDGNVSNPASVALDFDAQSPTAVDDTVTGLPTNTPAVADVLGNDSDPDGTLDPATVQIAGTAAAGDDLIVPGEGTWSVDTTTGEITFTPEAGFTADPTPITYTVADNDGNVSNPASVALDFDAQSPTAVDDTVTGLPTNTPAVADVLDNDSDPDGTLDPATVQIAGTAAAGDDLIVPGEGTWSVDTTTGEITFTPEAGFTADPTPITYTVADNDGNVSNPASVALDFDAQSPTAVDDTVTGLPTNTPAVADVLGNDSDPDGTLDPATVQIAGTAAAGDDLIVPGEGTWSVDTTTGEITFTPEAGFTADPTPITYTVADNDGNVSNPASVALDFDAQSPTAVDDTVTGLPTNTPAVADVLDNDSDPDGTLDPATVQIAGTAAAGDDLIVPGEGTWSVDTTTGEITFTPEAGFTADPTPITYTVADNDGNVSNPASVALDFDAQSPTAVDDTVTGLPTNTPAVADVLDNDSDPDGTLDPATVQIAGTAAAGDDLIVPGEGTWSVDTTTGEITFTPEAGFTADPTPITYTVADNDGNVSNPASVALDFDAQSPTAVDDTVTGLPTNTPAVADVLGNDSDPDGTLDPATVQIAGTAAAGDDLIVPGEGTWSVDTTTGEITFTPEAGFTADPTPITYTVADNDGNVSNPASVSGDYEQLPSITLSKTATLDDGGDGVASVGDLITYTFTVTNTGNVTLTGVTVRDPLVTIIGGPIDLAPGASDANTFRASYALTQDDIDNGSVTNTARVTAEDPDGVAVSSLSDDPSDLSDRDSDGDGNPDDPTVTPLPDAPGIALVKQATVADTNGSGVTDAGDVITYTFDVTNTGNVTLSSIDVDDPLLGGVIGTIAGPLAPGATDSSLTATYTIVQSDVDAGSVNNTAIASGDTPTAAAAVSDVSGSLNSNNDPTILRILSLPELSTSLSVDITQVTNPNVGDNLTYTLVVTNTGNVVLSPVNLSDELGVGADVVPALAPGESVTLTFTYALTYEDILSGSVTNVAQALGQSSAGANASSTSNEVATMIGLDLVGQIKDELEQILEDDLRETTTKQSMLFEDIAGGARDRLAALLPDRCVAALNDEVRRQPILFDTASAVIRDESAALLDRLARIMGSCERARIEIGGHTDFRGSNDYNLDLSQRRVNAVLEALRQRNVNVDRLVAVGYGESLPVADNSTPEGMAMNRRVEFRVIQRSSQEIAENMPCGVITPFDVAGSAEAGAAGLKTNGTFGGETFDCYTGERRIIRGDFSLSDTDDLGTQAALSATWQFERLVSAEHLRGYFFGLYGSRTNVLSGRADGDITGFGGFGGLYGAKALNQSRVILDYYAAGSIGRHNYDLTFADTAPTDIDADGRYDYWALFGGVSVSGEQKYESFTLVPRLGAHLRYASAFDANVTASIPGYSESSELSLEDQSGIRFLGEFDFAFGNLESSSEDQRYTQTTIFTPGLYCDAAFGDDQEAVCGIRTGLELLRTDALRGISWGFDANLEVDSIGRRGSMGAFYERRLGAVGSLNFGIDLIDTMRPSVTGNLEVKF
nr:OmpA family protein [Roseivivax sp. THAF40]